MSTYYYVKDIKGNYLFDNYPRGAEFLMAEPEMIGKVISIDINGKPTEARLGYKSNHEVRIHILTTESKFVHSPRLFKKAIDLSVIAIGPLLKFKKSIEDTYTDKVQEFIHNVTSINSYSIQDLFLLIPQSILGASMAKQEDIIKSAISEKPNVAVKSLLKLLKHNLAMKVEFSVFERVLKPYTTVQRMDNSIRTLILSVLQIFIDDFEAKRIEVSIDNCEKRVYLDYDSMFVSLYYLFDNAIKYCCHNSQFRIFFKEEADCFSVCFSMVSISIKSQELQKLFEKGYRSEVARKLNDKGNGIGMYRMKMTLKLNDAEIEIVPRHMDYKREINKIQYEANLFKIKFNGQQSWFKGIIEK